jgi:acetoin utilization deacetylase AcuC-like enzyme
MPVSVFTHPACVLHDAGEGHPESPERLRAVLERLLRDPAAELVEAAPAPRDMIEVVHPAGYLAYLEEVSHSGGGSLFLDTSMSEDSWSAVLGAAGAVRAALSHAHAGQGNAFAAIRPPGHHALSGRAMGFCLVNNVVVAAREAQRLGRRHVLIVDWDVHHGNGTQALVENDDSIRFVSLHQHPWYPGTGMADERGVGNVFNVPRRGGLPAELYVKDLWDAIIAATSDWAPDVVLVSAGFDAMQGDPLGNFTLEPVDYAELTTRLRTRLPDTPLVGLLEGGYIPERLADGVAAHVAALG